MAQKLTWTEINVTKINTNFGNSRSFHEALISYNTVCYNLFTDYLLLQLHSHFWGVQSSSDFVLHVSPTQTNLALQSSSFRES